MQKKFANLLFSFDGAANKTIEKTKRNWIKNK